MPKPIRTLLADIDLPEIPTTDIIGSPGRDSVVYVGTNTNGYELRDTRLVIMDSGRAGLVTVNTDPTKKRWPTMEDMSVTGCIIEAKPRDNKSKWGLRRYGLTGYCYTNSNIIRNLGLEHPIYDEVFGGTHRYSNLWLDNSGANGLQLRVTEQPPKLSPHYLDARYIEITDVVVSECGQARGAGRAGFGISIKDMGPNTEVHMERVAVQTVKQRNVKSKPADFTGFVPDSFGAICVEYVGKLVIDNCYVSMLNPDRHAIQLFDFANKAPKLTAPKEVHIDGLELDNQVVVLRCDDTEVVRITNTSGTGQIRLMRFDAAAKVWKFWKALPWAPYSQG